MLRSEQQERQEDSLWDELKSRAAALIEKLEQGDFHAASTVIHAINEVRDRSIYFEVGKLTRGLHEAIRNFEIDTNPASPESERLSRMANAQERLDYVIKLTQSAADKTMDMVEAGIPTAAALGNEARELQSDWQRLLRREMAPEEFRELSRRIDQFLQETAGRADRLGTTFSEILLAQDFQDLSGQVLKRVITLVQEVEDRLVDLMRVAGQVEEITGLVRTVEIRERDDTASMSPEGPQIHPGRAGVVSGQDEVDDLLSSLGF